MLQADDARARPDPVALAMGVTFALIWSSAFTSAKIALVDAPPFLMLAARFTLSGAAGVVVALALGQRLPRDRRVWLAIALFGLCQNALYLGLNFWAMTRVTAGLAAIIASALPLAVAGLGRLVYGDRLPWIGVAGLAVGLAGVTLIMGGRVAGGADGLGVAACAAGLLALAAATLSLRGMAGGVGVLMAVGLQMLIGSAALWPVGLALEDPAAVNPTLSLALAFGYTTLFPGLVATVIWFKLVARIGATAASSFHFLNPALGVAIAALLLGETVDWVDGAGVAMVTLAILLVQRARAVDGAGRRA